MPFGSAGPNLVQPWDTGYGVNFNGSMTAGMQLLMFAKGMLVAANLYPDDPATPMVWDYFRNRRKDWGDMAEQGGWANYVTVMWALPFYDPLAPSKSATEYPLQAGLIDTDAQECIDAGLYCRPDTAMAIALSQTGWTETDTQVMIQGQAALPAWNEDNYGTAGNITILQNNGENSAFLLGGNGVGSGGLGSGQTPSSGLYDGNTISIYNKKKGDSWLGKGRQYHYAAMERFAGDPVTGPADNSYAYAMINLTPKVRDAANKYDAAAATQQSFYTPDAKALRVQRHVMHLKSGSGKPNYVVTYDDVNTGVPNELRAYWHYQISDMGGPPVRHPSWITTYDPVSRTVVLTVPKTGRLTSRFLAVSGLGNPGIALVREDTDAPWCNVISKFNLEGVCAGNYAKSVGGLPDAVNTGSYRVHVCSSADGVTCEDETSGEWITVHRSSTSTKDVMPSLNQPACRPACTVVEILDSAYPKVAMFARRGALLSSASFQTTHSGTAQYVISGLAAGSYRVVVGTQSVASAVTVKDGDNTLAFSAPAGAVVVRRIAAVGFLRHSGAAQLSGTGSGTGGVQGDAQAVPALSTSGAGEDCAQLGMIGGVSADPAGGLVMALSDYAAVLRMDEAGGLARVADNGMTAGDRLSFPAGVAVSASGDVYISDTVNHRIRKVSGGVLDTVAGTGSAGLGGDNLPAAEAQLKDPLGVAVDADGNVYIADTGNHRIRKVSGGLISTVAGNARPGFSGDQNNGTEASLSFPSGVAVDAAGNVYIADTGNHRIRKVSGGLISTVAGDGTAGFSGDHGPATSARLSYPSDVAIDAAGNLYIADTGNHRVRKVSGGLIDTIAGNGVEGSAGDEGAAGEAQLALPTSLSVDRDGTLYIADTGSERIRKISAGIITTVARRVCVVR